jgi:hypothetical protein
MEYLTEEDVDVIRQNALHYKEFCDKTYGEVIHFDSEALEVAIQQTDKVLADIMRKVMAEGTRTLDLHKVQTGYILGFANKACCVFTPPNFSYFMRFKKRDLAEEYFETCAAVYDPNTEFIIRLLRVLVEAHAYPCEKRYWEPKPYGVELPNCVEKQNGEQQEFISSLRRLISGITDAQDNDNNIVGSEFFIPFVYSVSMSNFLIEALSDCVVYGKADRYYSEDLIKKRRKKVNPPVTRAGFCYHSPS